MRQALIVEDHAATACWLRAAVEAAFPGVVVAAAASCGEARALLDSAAAEFDIALLDIGLPDDSGLALVSEVLLRRPSCYVVIATMFDDDPSLFAALRAGARGYLLKDGLPDSLVGHLRGISAGQPPLSAAVARRQIAHFAPPPVEDEARLTAREHDVLVLVAKGLAIGDVAAALGISPHTATGYLKSVYRKLRIGSRAEAALEAVRRGIVVP